MSFRKLCSGEEFSPELVRAALERGEDVNQRGPNNSSLFMFAATRNKIPLLRLMLEQPSVKVNLAGDDGFTALHLAVYRGNGEAVKLLLEHPSISVNLSCASTGFTALHKAAFQGRGEAVKLLLADPRVDVNCKDPDGVTPLILAARNEDNFDALKLLLADQRVEVNCEGSLTALRSAIVGKNNKAVKLLLDNDRVDVNRMDSDGYNALFIALGPNLVTSKDARILELLELFLSHPRVDLNCKAHGTTILHFAVLTNNVEAVRMILAETRFILHNALEEKEGTSAVGLAVIKGRWDILKELAHHPKVDLDVGGLGPDDLMKYEVFMIIRTF